MNPIDKFIQNIYSNLFDDGAWLTLLAIIFLLAATDLKRDEASKIHYKDWQYWVRWLLILLGTILIYARAKLTCL